MGLDIHFDHGLECQLPLSLHEPVNQVSCHFWRGTVQFEEAAVVAQRPGRPQFQCVCNTLVHSVVR